MVTRDLTSNIFCLVVVVLLLQDLTTALMTSRTIMTTTKISTQDGKEKIALIEGNEDCNERPHRNIYPTHRRCKTIDDSITNVNNFDGDDDEHLYLSLVLKGCDTFVAFPPLTPDGIVIFGKNSDRPAGEKQSITKYPAKKYTDTQSSSNNNSEDGNNDNNMVKCTYISIPQVESTYSVILSQIDWMWGAEMGTNECGVVIGNEAIWTKVEEINDPPSLLGMDLVRLGLERGSTANEAKDIITTLLEIYGQGGPCAENDPSFTYHNSFLIVDCNECWIVETAGKHWVAQRVTNGGKNISNCLSIRDTFDDCSKHIKEYAKQQGLWNGKDVFDFAKIFSDGGLYETESSNSRYGCGKKLLLGVDDNTNNIGTFNYQSMITILRDHDSGICMHGGFESTSSMVSVLHVDNNKNNQNNNNNKDQHWMTGKPYPCKSEFILQSFA